jgi:hypothetical protein
MPRRRAFVSTVFGLVALASAGGLARAQEATAEEPLRRLDPSLLSGGDYGVGEPLPLSGGAFGQPAAVLPADGSAEQPPAAPPPALRPAVEPPPRRRARGVEEDAYAAQGIRAGAFLVKPSLEVSGGFDTNPSRIDKGAKGSGFMRLRGEVEARSDWSRHEVVLKADGNIRKYVDSDTETGLEPKAAVTLDGRIDLSQQTKIETQLRASITTSSPGDAETPQDISGDELQTAFGATLGGTHRFNRFSLRLQGLVDRYLYNDPKLLGGGKLDNADRIYTQYEARLRGAYELSPRLSPFAEVAVDTRQYDETFSNDAGLGPDGLPVPGAARKLGSAGYTVRGGAQFELTRLVTGEASLGYGRQTPKEKTLTPVDGLLIDGSIAWEPTALTSVRFNAASSLQETTLAGAGGVLSRSFGVELEHRLRRNLSVTAKADFERSSYQGIGRIDDDVTLTLEAEYRLNRSLALTASYSHERLYSSVESENYDASIIEFGLRMRR